MSSLFEKLAGYFSQLESLAAGFMERVLFDSVGLTMSELAAANGANVVSASGTAQSIDWSIGRIWYITLTANCTITVPTPNDPGIYFLRLRQDATGNRLVTFSGPIDWPGGVAPTLTVTANKADDIRLFDYGGSRYDGSIVQDY